MSQNTIVILNKGTEDIFYDRMEGDIIVDYYMMCEVDEDGNVVKAFSFAYGLGNDHTPYFDLGENLEEINTLDDAKAFEVAKDKLANRDNEFEISSVIPEGPFQEKWY